MDFTLATACVGDKWDPVWVYRLYNMAQAVNKDQFDFKVICEPEKAEILPEEWIVPLSRDIVWTSDHHSKVPDSSKLILNVDKPQGCWAKLDFFIDQFGSSPVLGLDLDVVILEDLRPLLREEVHMPEDAPGHLNGSVYSFTPGKTGWKPPAKIPYRTYPRGEQEYVQNCTGAKPLTDCYSFKNNVASRPGKEPPPGARIVFFHGRPTPATDNLQQFHWISRTWKGLDRVERI